MANVFPCRFCSLSLKSVKGYVDHQILHRHEANGQFPCCVADCKHVFFKYSAFKTHCYRHHKNPSVSELDIMQGPYICENTSCQKQCTDLKTFLHTSGYIFPKVSWSIVHLLNVAKYLKQGLLHVL